MYKGKYTPSRSVHLVNGEDGVPSGVVFNYRSVIVMIIYISGHTCPDISIAFNCCVRYMFCPNHSHVQLLKQISWYLKLTQYRGLILNTNRGLFKFDSYLDTDFSGMYGYEMPDDPPFLRVTPVMSSYFHTFLFYVNQIYRQRHPSQLWKQKLSLYLTIAENCFLLYI